MCRLLSRASLGLLVWLLAGPGFAWAQPARTVDANQLLAIARGGLTDAARAAYVPLPAGQPQNRPFWDAVDAMGRALDSVTAAFAARSPTFFAALSAGSRNLAELRAVWSHTGLTAPQVANGVETLSTAYRLLRGSYGWEALRRQQGGALTPEEQRRFQAQQQAQAALAQRLDALRAQAAQAGDAQAANDLAQLAAQAQALAQAQNTLEAYLAAQAAAEALQGELAGDSRSAQPATRKILKKAAPLVEDLATDASVGFVFSTDLAKVDDTWAPLTAPVEVPPGVDLGTAVATVPAEGAAPGISGSSLLEDEAAEGAKGADGAGGRVVPGEEDGAEAETPATPTTPATASSEEGKEKAAAPAGKETAAKKADGKPDETAETQKTDKAKDEKGGGKTAEQATLPPPPASPAPPPAAEPQ